jgi:hypothetical protein
VPNIWFSQHPKISTIAVQSNTAGGTIVPALWEPSGILVHAHSTPHGRPWFFLTCSPPEIWLAAVTYPFPASGVHWLVRHDVKALRIVYDEHTFRSTA